MADLSATEFSVVLVAFRVIFGLVFAAHGWAKRKGGIEGTANWFDSMGMRPGRVHAHLASLTEIGTGLMLALGVLTSFAAAGVVGVLGYTFRIEPHWVEVTEENAEYLEAKKTRMGHIR